jgi:opacity protein-like surface antigen
MFNSYLDFPINDQFQVFAGAGLGIARIDEKGNLAITVLNNTKTGDKIKSKKKQNFAYSLTTGISYKIADNTNIELSYKWSDYGKTKFKDKDVTKNRYRGHSILTGIRYSM